MNTTIGILGYDFKLSTSYVEKIILKTKASIDQDHIQMHIVINNKLLDKKEDKLIEIINNLEKINTKYLVLTFENQYIYEIIKRNTNIPILNNTFNIEDETLIKQIIELTGREVIQ